MATKTKLESVKLDNAAVEKYEVQGLASVSKDVKNSVVDITTKDELRFLVDSYYQTQNYRIAIDGQLRSIEQGYDTMANITDGDTPVVPTALSWVSENIRNQEKQILKLLDSYTDNDPVGKWCKQIIGIGPVLSAAMLAYFDVTKCTHSNQFCAYAGLNDNNTPWLGREKAKQVVKEAIEEYDGKIPARKALPAEVVAKASLKAHRKVETVVRAAVDESKGYITKESLEKYLAKIPYNKELKRIMWNMGQCFIKVSGKENSLYGRLYKERKALYTARNEAGEYAERAKNILATTNIGKGTDAYKAYSQGKLPAAHINNMTIRYVEKMFLSHLFDAMYINEYQCEPPRPYVIEHCGHTDFIQPEVPFDALYK